MSGTQLTYRIMYCGFLRKTPCVYICNTVCRSYFSILIKTIFRRRRRFGLGRLPSCLFKGGNYGLSRWCLLFLIFFPDPRLTCLVFPNWWSEGSLFCGIDISSGTTLSAAEILSGKNARAWVSIDFT